MSIRGRATIALAALALLAALLTPSAEAKRSDARARAALSGIAAHHMHGWSGDQLPLSELEARLARGEQIVTSCGTVARLGIRAVRRAGYDARLVGSFTREPLNGRDDGHIMMEVRLRRGWTVYDLLGNRAAPAGVGIAELVREQRWRIIAHDALYDEDEVAAGGDPEYDRAMFADMNRWYRRVLGVATVTVRGSIYFHDARQRARGLALGYRWASAAYWRRLTR